MDSRAGMVSDRHQLKATKGPVQVLASGSIPQLTEKAWGEEAPPGPQERACRRMCDLDCVPTGGPGCSDPESRSATWDLGEKRLGIFITCDFKKL